MATQNKEFGKFRTRKKPNKKRTIVLLIALLIVLALWLKSEAILEMFEIFRTQ